MKCEIRWNSFIKIDLNYSIFLEPSRATVLFLCPPRSYMLGNSFFNTKKKSFIIKLTQLHCKLLILMPGSYCTTQLQLVQPLSSRHLAWNLICCPTGWILNYFTQRQVSKTPSFIIHYFATLEKKLKKNRQVWFEKELSQIV